MSYVGKYLFITLLTLSTLFFFHDNEPANGQGESCEALSDCTGVDELPTAEACEADSCSCAQQIVCLLGNENAVDTWPKVPGGALEFNDLFFHKRFAQTQISPDALASWEKFMDPLISPVSMPDKTIVIKPSYNTTATDPAQAQVEPTAVYAFIKLDGYCPDDAKVGDQCLGGDWFVLELNTATDGDVKAGDISNYGKSSLCMTCHVPAEQEGDWLWHIFISRRYK